MRKMLTCFLTLSLCAAVLCLPAAAAENDLLISPAPAAAPLGPVQVWGQATQLESGSLLLKNSDKTALHQEVVIHLTETPPIVDAVSGLPMDASDIKNGDTVYAWVGPAMTMSLPPQASAVVVVANIPADFAVPQYYEISGLDQTVTAAVYPAPPRTQVNLPTASGEVLTIPVTAQVSPWLTKNIVTVDDLTPGTRILVWRGTDNVISRVQMLPSQYQGWVSCGPEGQVSVNGEELSVKGKAVDGEVLVPIRAVAEAAGYQVDWIAGKGAVVSASGKAVFSVLPGAETALTADDEVYLGRPCVIEKGVTYLQDADLARLLNLFLSRDA